MIMTVVRFTIEISPYANIQYIEIPKSTQEPITKPLLNTEAQSYTVHHTQYILKAIDGTVTIVLL